MQIQIDIDDELMRKALQASDQPTTQAVIEDGLRLLICMSSRTSLADMFGLFPDGIDHPDRS